MLQMLLSLRLLLGLLLQSVAATVVCGAAVAGVSASVALLAASEGDAAAVTAPAGAGPTGLECAF
jgi:hypothetical protein